MKLKIRFHFPVLVILTILGVYLAACAAQGQSENTSTSLPAPTRLESGAPTPVWPALSQVTPIPYASPLPSPEPTSLDGTYAKSDPNPPQWWVCLRCADYRQAGGAWRLQFDRGVMRIYYEVTGWHSLASYTVLGDHLYLFNDPYCKDVTGEYKWRLADGNLTLEVVNDPCSFQLRGKNLDAVAWAACPKEGATSEESPRGCTDVVVKTMTPPAIPDGLNVTVRKADVRLATPSPDIYLNASGADQPAPEGVQFSYSDDSILYGTSRVLWTDGGWMEILTDAPYTSIGVQFRGDYVIGWARVLFDGQEVWRGDTSKIWSDLRIHGGYIEVSGFEPGTHTLRVERLNIDSRPVVVAFFGFNR
jgi:hypothetical protein